MSSPINGHATPATVVIQVDDTSQTFETVEDAVLALLQIAHPVFLGRLKIDYLGRMQRLANGILPRNDVGQLAVHHVSREGD